MGYGCFNPCGYGGYNYGCFQGYPVAGAYYGRGRGFALIVVLFILLIIVGASRFGGAC